MTTLSEPSPPSTAVLTEVRGSTLIVTIDRPAVRNAADVAVYTGVGEALEQADADEAIRAVILTGSGSRSFCAGADLKAQARGDFDALDPRVKAWGFAGFTRHEITKPVIAAVNGLALGGGTEIVLQADLAIAVEDARFGFPEVSHGAYPGAGGSFRIGRQIPPKIALEMLLTAQPISARRALALGLVNQVVAQDDLLPTALALAEQIAGNAPVAVRVAKQVARGITDGRRVGEDDDWRRSEAADAAVLASADLREGLQAFAEKRLPEWTGR